MKEAIDLAGQKSGAGRVKALDALCSGLLKRYGPDLLENQQMTVCDVVQRAVKKGKGGEVVSGARLAVLLALQLADCEEVYRCVHSCTGAADMDKGFQRVTAGELLN